MFVLYVEVFIYALVLPCLSPEPEGPRDVRWVVSFLVETRFDTFRTSHSRASAYGSLHESPSSVSTVLVPHRSVPSRQALGWPLWCDIVRGGRPLCSYAVARRWHPIQGPMAHALSTVFDSSGPSLKHGGRCAHRTRGYHHQLHDRSTSSSLCSG